MVAARHAFRLERVQADGRPLRAHLVDVAEQTGRRPADLDGPPIPAAGEHVWRWFRMLRAETPAGTAIGSRQFLDFQAVEGVRLRAWERAAIRALDAAAREVAQSSIKAD